MTTVKKNRPARIGIVMLAVTLLLFTVLFSKDRIATTAFRGEKIELHFARDYKLRPFVSVVKVGFVPVGKVSGVERDDDGAVVTVKVDRDVLKTLGSAPTATIRSTTMLGGSYFVDLEKGGDDGEFTARSIPLERTEVPVELDKVARALQPGALEGTRDVVDRLDQTLDAGGDKALQRLVRSSPDTLAPLGRVLTAAEGDDPDRDLARVVTGLEGAARSLTQSDGQLDRILTNLETTTDVLATRSPQIASAVGNLPSALDRADVGLKRLDGTLDTLSDVADDVRPVARELDGALDRVDPVLKEARPLVKDLRTVVADAQPVFEGLVPTAKTAEKVMEDLDGPVLDRANGPVREWLYAPYKGTGEYSMTKTDKPMYQEITYMLANLDRASGYTDRNGHAVSFQPGVGAGSIGGLPISPEQIVKLLTSGAYLDEPVNTIPPVSTPGGAPGSAASAGEDPLTGLGSLLSPLQGLLSKGGR